MTPIDVSFPLHPGSLAVICVAPTDFAVKSARLAGGGQLGCDDEYSVNGDGLAVMTDGFSDVSVTESGVVLHQ